MCFYVYVASQGLIYDEVKQISWEQQPCQQGGHHKVRCIGLRL